MTKAPYGALLLACVLAGCSNATEPNPAAPEPLLGRVALGTGNTLLDDTFGGYLLPITVIASNLSGNPLAHQPVHFSLVATAYQKGSASFADTDSSGAPDHWLPDYSVPRTVDSFGCTNEDLNHDRVLQPGEDTNGDGTLQPGEPVVVLAAAETDDNGIATALLSYPKNYADWLQVKVTVQLGGDFATSEGAVLTRVLPASAADLSDGGTPPANQVSPFGIAANCATPG